MNAGYADYLPVHLGESQKLYREGFIKLGAALVNVSLPDEQGRVSLGTSVDCSVAAIESAQVVIGVVNPHVPFAYGDLIPLEKFDYLVQDDTPLVTAAFAEPTPTEVVIGRNCAALVEDGDCIQMGIGALPNALAAQLVDFLLHDHEVRLAAGFGQLDGDLLAGHAVVADDAVDVADVDDAIAILVGCIVGILLAQHDVDGGVDIGDVDLAIARYIGHIGVLGLA